MIVFDETSDGGRELVEVGPGSVNDADFPVGVDVLEIELCALKGGRLFRVCVELWSLEDGVTTLSGGGGRTLA